MAELQFDSKFVIFLIVILVIVIVGVIIFRQQYPTEEERLENRHRLLIGLGVAILVAIGAYVLYATTLKSDKAPDRPEYGVREAFSEWRNQKKAVSEARKEAKAAGKSEDEVTQAARKAKADFRQVKRAGQEAAVQAKQQARAKLGMTK